MEDSIKDNGNKIKSMEKEYFNGLIKVSMLVNLLMDKKMGMEHIIGVMEEFIKAYGKMISKMDKEFLLI